MSKQVDDDLLDDDLYWKRGLQLFGMQAKIFFFNVAPSIILMNPYFVAYVK